MASHRVHITRPALRDAFSIYEWIHAESPNAANRWFRGLRDTIRSLSDMPLRCPAAPEAATLHRDIRQILYGKRLATYRILFDVDESTETGPRVRILRIRHGARLPLDAGGFLEALDERETGGET